MGIGNLNNNFGKLTAKTSINNVNAEKINPLGSAKTEKTENAGSLNSATLKEGEGSKFDSNNAFNGPTMVYAKSKKSWVNCVAEAKAEQLKKLGTDMEHVHYGRSEQDEMNGATAFIFGLIKGTWNYFRQ
ncbi:hypothetical protein IJ707_01425 [bacterium]|nr:hypothetical protein [bacterium]